MFYHIIPAIGTYLYLTFPTTINISPTKLKYICIFHNSLLIIFSFWTFVSLVQIMYTYGFVFQSNFILIYHSLNPYNTISICRNIMNIWTRSSCTQKRKNPSFYRNITILVLLSAGIYFIIIKLMEYLDPLSSIH